MFEINLQGALLLWYMHENDDDESMPVGVF